MGEILLYTIVTLCALGILSALILYFVAQKFKVYEDPRIDTVETLLPGANCGGCGYPGCRGFAVALVEQDDISALYCPVGGSGTMKNAAEYLGKAAPEKEPEVAVVRCGGTCDKRPRTNVYDGAGSCAVESALYVGETACAYGCLGQGDCVVVCNFGAIVVNPETGLAEVIEENCTACGACVKACPRGIIELRKQGPKNRKVYVNCINKDKGAVARKACAAACIACSKCVKTCPFEAITIDANLAYIDPHKCKLCRKCVPECPTGAIAEINFPPRKTETAAPDKEGGQTAKPDATAQKAALKKEEQRATPTVSATAPEVPPAGNVNAIKTDPDPTEKRPSTPPVAAVKDLMGDDNTAQAELSGQAIDVGPEKISQAHAEQQREESNKQ